MSLYQDKYRIESTRLRNWNYASNGHYFITICTKNRKCFFGKILDNKMILSEIGKFAYKYWQEIPNHFPFAQLDKFVIMPNHVHGIILIKNDDNHFHRDAINRVSTTKTNVITQNKNYIPGISGIHGGITGKNNPMFYKSISKIIRWYKGRCTFEINHIASHFQWQPRFYDHVIQNKQDLNRIQQYIQNNPRKWRNDGFYTLK